MTIRDIDITKGDSKAYVLRFTSGGTPTDITGWKVFFTIKNKFTDSDANAIVKVDQFDHSDPTGGVTSISLEPSQTDQPLGIYYYDIQIVKADGTVKTIQKGQLRISYEVTNRVS